MLHLLVFFLEPILVPVARFLIKPATRLVACYLMFRMNIYVEDLLCQHAVLGDFFCTVLTISVASI